MNKILFLFITATSLLLAKSTKSTTPPSVPYKTQHYLILQIGRPWGQDGYITSINNKGQVAGCLMHEWLEYDFIWEKDKGITLSSYHKNSFYGGGTFGGARPPYINSSGQISDQTINDLGERFFIDESNHLLKVSQSGTIETVENTQYWTPDSCLKVNNSGQIAGTVGEIGSIKTSIGLFDLNRKKLTVISTKESLTFSNMNDKGQVVGSTRHGDELLGFIWHEDFGFQIIPKFVPSAINNDGVIVGKSDNHGAIWKNGILHDINEMIGIKYDLDSDWSSIVDLKDINNKGWIIGCGNLASAPFGPQVSILIAPVE